MIAMGKTKNKAQKFVFSWTASFPYRTQETPNPALVSQNAELPNQYQYRHLGMTSGLEWKE